MADDAFAACLAFTLKYEGGFVDHPADPGGATNLGVTRATLARWRRSPVSTADVKALTRDEAGEIYRRFYWRSGGQRPAAPGRRCRRFRLGRSLRPGARAPGPSQGARRDALGRVARQGARKRGRRRPRARVVRRSPALPRASERLRRVRTRMEPPRRRARGDGASTGPLRTTRGLPFSRIGQQRRSR